MTLLETGRFRYVGSLKVLGDEEWDVIFLYVVIFPWNGVINNILGS